MSLPIIELLTTNDSIQSTGPFEKVGIKSSQNFVRLFSYKKLQKDFSTKPTRYNAQFSLNKKSTPDISFILGLNPFEIHLWGGFLVNRGSWTPLRPTFWLEISLYSPQSSIKSWAQNSWKRSSTIWSQKVGHQELRSTPCKQESDRWFTFECDVPWHQWKLPGKLQWLLL